MAIDNYGILRVWYGLIEAFLDKNPTVNSRNFDPGPVVLERLRNVTDEEVVQTLKRSLKAYYDQEGVDGLLKRRAKILKLLDSSANTQH